VNTGWDEKYLIQIEIKRIIIMNLERIFFQLALISKRLGFAFFCKMSTVTQ
jgi:hypothetical protein